MLADTQDPPPIDDNATAVPEESANDGEPKSATLCKNATIMSEKRISLAINTSILVTLTIFGILLSLPLRLLLDTKYYSQNQTNDQEIIEPIENVTIPTPIPLDHRKLQRCPRFDYEDCLMSIFQSDYDTNCTYIRANTGIKHGINDDSIHGKNEAGGGSRALLDDSLTESVEESAKSRRLKSIPVAVHILVTMLVILAIGAFVEALRICFNKLKDSTRADSANSRRGSVIDNPAQRPFFPRQAVNSQRSFEIQGVHRSAVRLFGARPPLFIRRSSFPSQVLQKGFSSLSITPDSRSNRISRRQSIETDEDPYGMHHRTHLIRRR